MSEAGPRADAYVYSVVRAVPNPRRGECVNLGVIVVAPDGHYSDARFGSVTRVRKLDADADIDSIRLFLAGISSSLPLHGSQSFLGQRELSLDPQTLAIWSKEFGGSVQLSEPRSVLASNPVALLDQLFSDYVGSATGQQRAMPVGVERTPTRGEVLASFDRSIATWGERQLQAFAGRTVRGRRAHHKMDRVLEAKPGVPVAVIEAINFGAKELTEVYGRRATICLAAEDLHEEMATHHIAAFAVHTTAPHDRLEALQESAELFRSKGVIPVLFNDLEPIRRFVGGGLQLE